MADAEDKIDLYAETDEEIAKYPASDECQHDTDIDDLFNDAIAGDQLKKPASDEVSNFDSDNQTKPDDENQKNKDGGELLRKWGVLVGNLTWWTTDQDIENALKEIGVDDMIEVKFYENRGNGQAKGHCSVHVGTDMSMRLIHKKLPLMEIHAKKPIVAAPTKAALAHFESQSKTRPHPMPNSGANVGPNGPIPRCPGPPIPGPPYGMPNMAMGGPRMMGPIRGPGGPPPRCGVEVGSPPSNRMPMGPHPLQHRNFSPQRPPMQMGFNPYNSRPPFRPHHQPMNMHYHGPHGIDPPPRGYPPNNEWMRAQGPSYPYHPQQGPPPLGPPMPHLPPGGPALGIGSPTSGPPAPHVNPAFFNTHYPEPGTGRSDSNGTRERETRPQSFRGDGIGSPSRSQEITIRVHSPQMKESEVEDIMSRNRTVSSSAISRAVTDAASGDFASAIETLVTAISLIRQSKVSKEDRCRILINSLQDTLHGIESKSYGRIRVRSRSRSRSRSRDRHLRKMRRRSRSRDRDYALRNRSRDRLFDAHRSRSSSRERECDRNLDRDRYRGDHDIRSREHDDDRSSRSGSGRHRDSEHDHAAKGFDNRSRR